MEYFLNFGPLGGLLGMLLVTTVIWSLVLAVTFEFARVFKAYDRTFFMNLLGPFWWLFEVLYIIFLLIVLAVIGSAAGVLLRDNFGIPYIVGVIFMLLAVGFLTFKGSGLIENFLSLWSMALYVVYGVFFVVALIKFGPVIQENFGTGLIKSGWLVGGFKYALYNLACVAAVFFCLTHIKTRKEAIIAGALAGPIGIIPGFFFFVAIVGHYPEILPIEVPAIYVLQKTGLPAMLIIFQVILFGTLIETGTGMIHSVNERIQSALKTQGKSLARWHRPLISTGMLLIALGFSTFGLINLIAKGYGAVSWGFLFVFILPVLTWGVIKIKNKTQKTAPSR